MSGVSRAHPARALQVTDTLLDTAQAAVRLGLSRRQVQHLIHQGTLPAVKHGRDYIITPEACDALPPRPVGWPLGRPRAKENER